ncbi:hypothetical protein HYN69_18680 (plasmid) [Gemmobacter aquarius]|uniref:Uncharacterized protein n=1 Tax=Paragemmobacter aquarius TaxID=2169400 RepID=A0A2S0US32_9RHOB|nr:hypothetical protein [Gemmobacter aquarius]AWB50626.1 hypothetical protein HYN69_18680 [Gemmobacter aquarius]
MTLLTLIFAAALALSLGIVSAVLLRIGGLFLMVFAMTVLFGFRWFSGYSHPTVTESLLILTLLQAGYLIGTLTPLADRIRRGEPAPRLTVKPRDDAE